MPEKKTSGRVDPDQQPTPKLPNETLGTLSANSVRVDDRFSASPFRPFVPTETRAAVELDEGKGGGIIRLHSGDTQRAELTQTTEGGRLRLFDKNGKPFAYLGDVNGNAELALGGANVLPARIVLRSDNYQDQIVLDGKAGDILLMNADCAEEFDVDDAVEPGTVLVLDDEPGRLRTSDQAYDSKVAGVVSGAGQYRPGIVLDRNGSRQGRQPVALVGKVFCKVDATSEPVRPGSLLTTSELPGHAMAVVDRGRAFGAVLGKALRGLDRGRGLIPILVALQ